MTPEVCYLECSNLGYRYYGLKNGDECHCGSNPNFHGKFTGFQVSNNACNIPCPGDKSSRPKMCGGETTLSFYTISKEFQSFVPFHFSHSAQNDVRTIPSIPKCDAPGKKWTQFYSSVTPGTSMFSKDEEKYDILRKFNGNLRDINLKGSLDLCGSVCTDESEPCNVDKEH